ncbi:hypothetical protein NX059_004313 [Plenodomus lindquistii]|nr:hypothetical protein NX059_004313 [Plenodomus lindquistii]
MGKRGKRGFKPPKRVREAQKAAAAAAAAAATNQESANANEPVPGRVGSEEEHSVLPSIESDPFQREAINDDHANFIEQPTLDADQDEQEDAPRSVSPEPEDEEDEDDRPVSWSPSPESHLYPPAQTSPDSLEQPAIADSTEEPDSSNATVLPAVDLKSAETVGGVANSEGRRL